MVNVLYDCLLVYSHHGLLHSKMPSDKQNYFTFYEQEQMFEDF